MRGVIYRAYREPPALAELPDPPCPDDGVVIEVRATGVCRSDLHAWLGDDPVPLPMVPGHEYAGVVAQVGPQVRDWAVGDRVTVPFVCGCGRCPVCADGATHVCPEQEQPGFTRWGSYAEQVAVPAADTNLVRLPEGLSWVAAAALGCRFATAYAALTRPQRDLVGRWVAVHGCGGVGLSAVQIAAALGARVVAVDVTRSAVDRAVALGAEAGVVAEGDVSGAVRGATGGGADVSLDAFGSGAAMRASLECLRIRGVHVQVGLMLAEHASAVAPWARVVGQEIDVMGVHGLPAAAYPGLLDLVASGRVDLTRLIGRTIDLADAPAALMAMTGPAPTPGLTVVAL